MRDIALGGIKSHSFKRMQYFDYNSISSSIRGTEIGEPQGSVLDPLFSEMYMKGIPGVSDDLRHFILRAE